MGHRDTFALHHRVRAIRPFCRRWRPSCAGCLANRHMRRVTSIEITAWPPFGLGNASAMRQMWISARSGGASDLHPGCRG